MSDVRIGVDLGGTRIKAVAIDEQGNILHQYYHPTNDGDDSVWKNAILVAVNELQKKLKTCNLVIGISAPGLPNADNSAIAFMPGRLQGLEDFNWTDFFIILLLEGNFSRHSSDHFGNLFIHFANTRLPCIIFN